MRISKNVGQVWLKDWLKEELSGFIPVVEDRAIEEVSSTSKFYAPGHHAITSFQVDL